jgi:thiamine transport system permease protein
VLSDGQLWHSVFLSLTIAICSAVLAVAGAAAILLTSRELRVNRHRDRMADSMELAGSLILAVPPLVLGTGVFIWLSPTINVFAAAPIIVIGVNALMGMPYVIRLLGPPMTQLTQRHDRLCASLGISGWTRFRLVEWPQLRASIGVSLALCAALSTGDLGVIALFGNQQTTTLPLLLYQRLGAYQMNEAAVTALILLLLCLSLFVAIERVFGGRRRA